MLPAIPTPPRRSMWTSTSTESSSTATRVSQGATLTRICFPTARLRCGRRRAEARAAFVDAELRDRVRGQREEGTDERPGTNRALGADGELERETLRGALHEPAHVATRVDAALARLPALRDRERRCAGEARDGVGDALAR